MENSDRLETLSIPQHIAWPSPLEPNFNHLRFWYYPQVNVDFREYQFKIVKTALCYNTLVAIPTGLGKTLIAASAILNYLLWFPTGKIVFLAPTRPLVFQQSRGVAEMLNFPAELYETLTGSMQKEARAQIYQNRRVLFMTPQILSNDLKNDIFPFRTLSLVIIDEAHRACGEYAYCKILKHLDHHNHIYRILALTATPATDEESIQNIINNLRIAKIEMRTEKDVDVGKYIHQRNIEVVQVDLNESIDVLCAFHKLLGLVIQPLTRYNILPATCAQNPALLTKTMVRQAFTDLRNRGKNFRSFYESANGHLSLILSLLHGKKLLAHYDNASFLGFFEQYAKPTTGNKKAMQMKKELFKQSEFQELLQVARSMANGDNQNPKLQKMVQILQEFIQNTPDSRCIIFTQYRGSAQSIQTWIERHIPDYGSTVFIGQRAGSGVVGMNQRAQLEAVEKFRNGEIKCIIATSIGEEGLDIGEVDLILCFDASESPIRMIQRFGRTGRKRNGRVIILSNGNHENDKFNKCIEKKALMETSMKEHNFSFYLNSPRMIPMNVRSMILRPAPEEYTPKGNPQEIMKKELLKGNPEELMKNEILEGNPQEIVKKEIFEPEAPVKTEFEEEVLGNKRVKTN